MIKEYLRHLAGAERVVFTNANWTDLHVRTIAAELSQANPDILKIRKEMVDTPRDATTTKRWAVLRGPPTIRAPCIWSFSSIKPWRTSCAATCAGLVCRQARRTHQSRLETALRDAGRRNPVAAAAQRTSERPGPESEIDHSGRNFGGGAVDRTGQFHAASGRYGTPGSLRQVHSQSGRRRAVVAAGDKGFAEGGGRGMLESILAVERQFYTKDQLPAYALARTYGRLGRKAETLTYLP